MELYMGFSISVWKDLHCEISEHDIYYWRQSKCSRLIRSIKSNTLDSVRSYWILLGRENHDVTVKFDNKNKLSGSEINSGYV